LVKEGSSGLDSTARDGGIRRQFSSESNNGLTQLSHEESRTFQEWNGSSGPEVAR
jgi:hypothetical protein